MSDAQEHHGSCYCGAVTVTVSGPPVVQGYCHCLSCRKWHSAPINAWSGWPANKVSVSGPITESDKDPGSGRISCSKCGGNVANRKPTAKMMVIYPMTLANSGLDFQPNMHIFYDERVMDVNDGLPKFVDVPESFGGSGKMAEEPEKSAWIRT